MEYLLLSAHKDRSDGDADDDDESEASGLGRIAVSNIRTEGLGEIVISAIKLKRSLPEWLKPAKTRNRVFHAVNGQVQFKETRGYLSQSCGFPALKDRVVVIVDASDLTFEAHNEIWKGDREHIRNTIIGERYQDVVTTAIKTSQALIDLQNEVAREELEQAAKTERDHLFQKLVQTDPNLAARLTDKDPVIVLPSKGAGDNGGDDGRKDFEGRYSPTFLKFEGKARETGVVVPINRTRPIAARTDAENGYLQRADNRGALIVDPAIFARFGLNAQLHNGRLTIYLDPVSGAVQVGDEIVLNVGLQDASMPQPVEDSITVRITDEAESRPKQDAAKTAKAAASDKGEKEGTGKPAPTRGLPPHRLMTEDGRKIGRQESIVWPDGFNEYDGGSIQDLGEEGIIYNINYDNAYHIKYRRAARGGDVGRDVMTEKYILGMRILLMGYEHALRTLTAARNGGGAGIAEFHDDFRRMAARGAASTVLALAENLPKIIDRSVVVDAQDVE
jgi:hypothetical protein